MTGTLGLADRAIRQAGSATSLRTRIERADLSVRPSELVVIAACLGVAAGAAATAWTGHWWAFALVILITPAVTSKVLDLLAKRRDRRFADQLPDALVLISSSLSAGHTFLRSIQLMATEAESPLADELRRVVSETQLGTSLVDSLEHLSARVRNRDLEWMVQAIRIQQQTGGHLTELMATLAEVMRGREEVRREIAVLTAEGRMSAWVLGLMPIALFFAVETVNPRLPGSHAPGLGHRRARPHRPRHGRRRRHDPQARTERGGLMDGPMIAAVAFGAAGAAVLGAGVIQARDEREANRGVAYIRQTTGDRRGRGATVVTAADLSRVARRRLLRAGSPEPFRRRVLRPNLDRLAAAGAAFLPKDHRAHVRAQLAAAGLDGRRRPEEIIAGQVAGGGLGLLLGAIVIINGGLSTVAGILCAVVLAIIGVAIPQVWLSHQVDARRDAIRRDLPDTLDLLAISVEAGVGLEGAMAVVTERMQSPLSDELDRTLQEMSLGLSRHDALTNMKHRSEVPELTTFIGALLQADVLGMPIGKVLKIQATEMRAKRRQWSPGEGRQAPGEDPVPAHRLHLPGGPGGRPRPGDVPDRRGPQVIRRHRARLADQRGAAMIEMALVVGLLAFLLFGIITVGITLGFRQSMIQATDDAARAAAVAPGDVNQIRAEAAANRSASAWGERCGEGGLTCSFIEEPCAEGGGQCMTIELTYDLEDYPRVPSAALVDGLLPDHLTTTAVVEVSE